MDYSWMSWTAVSVGTALWVVSLCVWLVRLECYIVLLVEGGGRPFYGCIADGKPVADLGTARRKSEDEQAQGRSTAQRIFLLICL